LKTLPGVDQRTAEGLVAEIGTDRGRFPTSGHLASWAGMCPGHNEGAGPHRSRRTTKGERWTRQLVRRLEKLGHKVTLEPKEEAA
jgi:transposase